MDYKMFSGIIGFVVGDSLGVPIEFMSREFLKNNPVKNMIGYGSHNVPKGTWSDDTSLILATMDSIKNLGYIDFNDVMRRYVRWMYFGEYTATDVVFDVGLSTRKSIMNYKNGMSAINCGAKSINENGNGSLMRMLPFVYYLKFLNYSEKEKRLLINYASSITHAHEISQLGCNIYADYVSFLLDDIDKFEALKLLKEIDYSKYYSKVSLKEYQRILNGDIKSLTENEISSTGYVVSTLEASIWCTLNNNTFEDALISAVNLGNDTDTVGAITGSFNGIIYGEDNIPKKWLEDLKKEDYLKDLTSDFINKIKENHSKLSF